MYLPRLFVEADRATLLADMRARGFGLFMVGDELSHLPFLVDDDGTIRAHCARPNALLAKIVSEPQVRLIVSCADAYVSPRWYEASGEQVPTWNYMVVHARGRGRLLDRDGTRRVVDELSRRYEGDDWRLDALDPAFVDELLDGIVGFAIDEPTLQGKSKISQNRTPADRARVIAALEARGRDDDRVIAARMRSKEGETP